MTLSVYTASKTAHADKWRALRSRGVNVISTWIDEAGAGETLCFTDLWIRCVREASTADIVMLYREAGEVLKGALVEAGAALGNGRAVWLVGDGTGASYSFQAHPLVRRIRSLDDATAELLTLALAAEKCGCLR